MYKTAWSLYDAVAHTSLPSWNVHERTSMDKNVPKCNVWLQNDCVKNVEVSVCIG